MIQNSEIQQIFDTAKSEGHPDPVGFVARTNLLTGFNPQHTGEGNRVGITGIRSDDLESAGVKEPLDLIENLVGAVKLDQKNYGKFKDENEMHKKFFSPRGNTDIFMRDLHAEKKRLAPMLERGITDQDEVITNPGSPLLENDTEIYVPPGDSDMINAISGIGKQQHLSEKKLALPGDESPYRKMLRKLIEEV